MFGKLILIVLVATVPTGKNSLSHDETRMVKEINRWRAERDLPPLKVDPILMKVARKSAPYFSHQVNGKWVWERARAAGFDGFATDNIAKGHESPKKAVRHWGDEKHSSGHDKQMRGYIMLNGRWKDCRFDRVGVGIKGHRYIAIFGKKHCKQVPL